MGIVNIANMGRFSSDRAIQEYADKVWKVAPCPVISSRAEMTWEIDFDVGGSRSVEVETNDRKLLIRLVFIRDLDVEKIAPGPE